MTHDGIWKNISMQQRCFPGLEVEIIHLQDRLCCPLTWKVVLTCFDFDDDSFLYRPFLWGGPVGQVETAKQHSLHAALHDSGGLYVPSG